MSNYTVFREKYSLDDVQNRVDLLIESSDFVLYVEVKIDAPEGSNQITRYSEGLKRRAKALGKAHSAVIYLTPEGRDPNQAQKHDVILASWKHVAEAIDATMRAERIGSGELTGRLLTSLSRHLRSL
jgi:hypothetical protein